jgi:hypothetical protein
MASKKMSKREMDDHDDAHFSGNPAYREKKSKRGARGKKSQRSKGRMKGR